MRFVVSTIRLKPIKKKIVGGNISRNSRSKNAPARRANPLDPAFGSAGASSSAGSCLSRTGALLICCLLIRASAMSGYTNGAAASLRQARFPSASSLPTELGQRRAQRSARDLKQPLKRPVELEDQKNRTGDGQRADTKDSDYGSVARSEETEACEDDTQPEHQDHQER